MKKSLVLGAGRGPRLAVLELLKRSGEGMSVQEISEKLGMSYMGVKSHCVALEATGYISPRRAPATKGRPRLLYTLAASGERFFQDDEQDLALGLLKEAAKLFGATAPQKLLLQFFRTLREKYLEQISATDSVARARQLAGLRDKEGRMAEFKEGSPWQLNESHNPMTHLMQEYPEARAMEEHLIGEVVGVPIKRNETGGRVTFVPFGANIGK